MTGSNAGDDKAASRTWYTHLLDKVVEEMISLKAVSGVAVQASPVWMVPNEMLMAKVWGIGAENDFIWTMSIDKLLSDYIAGSLAATPKDVARHFSMKWQMDADRLVNFAKSKASGGTSEKQMQEYSSKLIQYAETLYELSNRDDVWQEPQTFTN